MAPLYSSVLFVRPGWRWPAVKHHPTPEGLFYWPFSGGGTSVKSYSLLPCGLFYEAICFKSCLVLFCSCVFSPFPFSIAITSLAEERANLSAFRTFVRFALVWFCLFPLPLGSAFDCDTSRAFSYLCFTYVTFVLSFSVPITKTCLFKDAENFTTKKWKFSVKNSDIFHISAQHIDRGYSLEPPRRGVSNKYPQSMFFSNIRKIMYTPVNPSFTV